MLLAPNVLMMISSSEEQAVRAKKQKEKSELKILRFFSYYPPIFLFCNVEFSVVFCI